MCLEGQIAEDDPSACATAPMWESWGKLQTLTFGLAQPQPLCQWRMNQQKKYPFLPISVSLSLWNPVLQNKQTNKKQNKSLKKRNFRHLRWEKGGLGKSWLLRRQPWLSGGTLLIRPCPFLSIHVRHFFAFHVFTHCETKRTTIALQS